MVGLYVVFPTMFEAFTSIWALLFLAFLLLIFMPLGIIYRSRIEENIILKDPGYPIDEYSLKEYLTSVFSQKGYHVEKTGEYKEDLDISKGSDRITIQGNGYSTNNAIHIFIPSTKNVSHDFVNDVKTIIESSTAILYDEKRLSAVEIDIGWADTEYVRYQSTSAYYTEIREGAQEKYEKSVLRINDFVNAPEWLNHEWKIEYRSQMCRRTYATKMNVAYVRSASNLDWQFDMDVELEDKSAIKVRHNVHFYLLEELYGRDLFLAFDTNGLLVIPKEAKENGKEAVSTIGGDFQTIHISWRGIEKCFWCEPLGEATKFKCPICKGKKEYTYELDNWYDTTSGILIKSVYKSANHDGSKELTFMKIGGT
jgi:hypothetical protein